MRPRPAAASMDAMNASRSRLVGLAAVTALSLGVVAYATVVYGSLDPETSVLSLRETRWHYALLLTHIATGAVALLLGPLQFFRRIRTRHPRVHRWIGRTYLFAGVFPSALVGVPVALLSVEGPWASAGLLVGDLAWLATAVVAYRAARRHDFRRHATWMTWNFALSFSAVTFRIWLGVLIGVQVPLLQTWYDGDFGALFSVAYGLTTWLAFLPNVLAVVLVQRWARARRHRRAAGLVPVATGAAVTTE